MQSSPKLQVFLLSAALGLAFACATPSGLQRAASPEERAAFTAALAALPQAPDVAEAGLEDFLSRYPQSPLADDAGEKLAALAAARGANDEAIGWLERVVLEHPDGDRSNAVQLELARLLHQQGSNEQAARAVSRVDFDELSPAERARGYRLASLLAKAAPARVRWLSRLRGVLAQPDSLRAVDAEIDALLQGMTADELERALDGLRDEVPAARVALRLAERSIDAGDIAGAGEWLDRSGGYLMTESDVALQASLRRRYDLRSRIRGGDALPTFAEVADLPAPNTEGASGTIGVVLPLSGPFARFGEASLRGVLLAARIYDETVNSADSGTRDPLQYRARLRVVIRDSRGEPARAAEAVRELAAREDLVAIVGPLLSGEAEAAAQMAESVGVPLLTLTSREEVARNRNNAFRMRTTPADEVEVLVEHAMGVLGAKRFAILYPADSFGRGMRKHFWNAVEARGGVVTAVARYSPDANDFAGAIRSMIGYRLLSESEKEALRERNESLARARRLPSEQAALVRDTLLALPGPEGRPLPPIVDFDALFIPDAHDKVVLLAPQLSFHDIRGVQLLGSDGWNHPDVPRIARQHVRGAVVSSLFYRDSQFPFVRDFVERFRASYDTEPDVFAASAHDAANLVLTQLVAGRISRDAVRDGIGAVQAYPGASGIATILPDGNAHKRPFLLGIRGGKIISLD